MRLVWLLMAAFAAVGMAVEEVTVSQDGYRFPIALERRRLPNGQPLEVCN